MRNVLLHASSSVVVLALSFPGSATITAQELHPFSVHDLLAMDRISDPRPSPAGDAIAFVVRKTDLEADRGRTDLWLVSVDGTELKQLTTHEESDSSPRWSPDGASLFFLSGRSGSSQIWRLPLEGGEAVRVTDLPLDVSNLILSRDGSQLGFTLRVFPDCPSADTVGCTVERLEERQKRKASGRTYERLFVRHWDTWEDGRRSHLFVMPATGGKAVDVMPDMDADTPSTPFGGPSEITFTPDGRSVIFTARNAGREEAWSTNFDLYLAPADGSSPPRSLTGDNDAWDTDPTFSPDGHTLAYRAMSRPGYESDRFRVVLRSWPGGQERILTENWDRSPGSLAWSEDGRALYGTAANLGQTSLFAIDASSGAVQTLVEDGTVRSPAAAGGKIVFGREHLRSPTELYTILPDGSGMTRITETNDEKVASTRMGDPEQFTFKGWNDETVYAYVVKPAGLDPSQKYPVAFLIHGGPQGSFSNDFHYRWNPQVYAGAGYAAVMVDFHGSVGYGQAFTDSIRGDWGGKPLMDLVRGLDAALERYPWMDGERVAALGASFGGYMINWIAGKWPSRFRCLVNHDGNLDERMAYFDTDELWFPEWDHEGTPWTNLESYEKHNPVRFVENWRTPMLVIHGGRDYRVVDTQGLSTFTALQRRGIPSKLLYFPDESHWVLKPANSVQWHETVLDWLNRWTKSSATSSR